jgi:hypothetical protein
MNKNVVGWFEIPVTDMDRAVKFYETVLDVNLSRKNFGTLEMALFPGDSYGMGTSGSLLLNEKYYKPSQDGILIYFTAQSGDLSNELSKVEKSGGRIIIPRTQISEDFGYMAVFIDPEGNRIALHSQK